MRVVPTFFSVCSCGYRNAETGKSCPYLLRFVAADIEMTELSLIFFSLQLRTYKRVVPTIFQFVVTDIEI